MCIIDTGLDYKHPDLAANVWMNPVEMAGPGASAANGWQNGIDDDGDGASGTESALILLCPCPCTSVCAVMHGGQQKRGCWCATGAGNMLVTG